VVLACGAVVGCLVVLTFSHLPQAARATAVENGAPASVRVDPVSERAQMLESAAASVRDRQQQLQLAERSARESANAEAVRTESERLTQLREFAWPTQGEVGSGWGMRRHPILGYVRLHNGSDIGGKCGNPIYSVQAGTVTAAGYSGSAGNNLRVDHGQIEGKRVETSYLHLSKLAVRAGQEVAKGELVGYVGSTGLSTACHLHLALYEDGVGSDPVEYLKRG
jgi:Membrane proteins related to metalloendopeptidases